MMMRNFIGVLREEGYSDIVIYVKLMTSDKINLMMI
jgi:hypothetical protein